MAGIVVGRTNTRGRRVFGLEGVFVVELMTIKDVARKLGVSENWIYSHLRLHKPLVPHIRLGGHIRFREGDIDRWIEEQVQNAVRLGTAC
jgi:excisionase family DNA binding protein